MAKSKYKPPNGVRQLADILARIEEPDLVLEFLRCLLTNAELADIGRRWELVRLLDQGVTQRRIAGQLGMSLCKITRGSRELKKEHSAFKRILREYVD